jgi:hypothetical protein
MLIYNQLANSSTLEYSIELITCVLKKSVPIAIVDTKGSEVGFYTVDILNCTVFDINWGIGMMIYNNRDKQLTFVRVICEHFKIQSI